MKMTRKHVAAHEGGHAVVAVHQRVAFADVWIGDDPAEEGEGGAVNYLPGDFHTVAGCEGEVIRKMGGEAGVRVAGGRRVGRITTRDLLSSGMYGDYVSAVADIKKMVGRINGGCIYNSWIDEFFDKQQRFHLDKYIDRCYRKAYSIVREHREFHARVTKALVERGRLTSDEVMELRGKGNR
jgi:hypothetical protein